MCQRLDTRGTLLQGSDGAVAREWLDGGRRRNIVSPLELQAS
jgi:hypothetical protein